VMGSSLLATTTIHPGAPIFVSPHTNCGSVVFPRQFTTRARNTEQQLRNIAVGLFTSDCDLARQHRQSGVIFTLVLGVITVALGLWPRSESSSDASPQVLSEEDATAEARETTPSDRRSILAHPMRTVALGLALTAILGMVLAVHTRDEVTLAQEFDAKAAGWVAKYPPRVVAVVSTISTLIPDLQTRNFPELARKCQLALDESHALASM